MILNIDILSMCIEDWIVSQDYRTLVVFFCDIRVARDIVLVKVLDTSSSCLRTLAMIYSTVLLSFKTFISTY